jgi:hypothetical protein
MKKFILAGVGSVILVQPIVAHAQFGALGSVAHRATGGSASTEVAGVSPDAFLAASVLSTKNVMIAAALIAQALEDRTKLAGVKIYADQVENCADPKALDAMKDSLNSNVAALNARKDLAGDVTSVYNAGNAQQKKLIGVAIVNLAIGIYRDTQLTTQAPGVISSMGSNPMNLSHITRVKLAAGLLALQSKGLVSVGAALPKMMSAVKIAAPAMAATTEPTQLAFN